MLSVLLIFAVRLTLKGVAGRFRREVVAQNRRKTPTEKCCRCFYLFVAVVVELSYTSVFLERADNRTVKRNREENYPTRMPPAVEHTHNEICDYDADFIGEARNLSVSDCRNRSVKNGNSKEHKPAPPPSVEENSQANESYNHKKRIGEGCLHFAEAVLALSVNENALVCNMYLVISVDNVNARFVDVNLVLTIADVNSACASV